MQTYLVGGAVRDRLLGLPPGDRDWVVVGATPEHPRTGLQRALRLAFERHKALPLTDRMNGRLDAQRKSFSCPTAEMPKS